MIRSGLAVLSLALAACQGAPAPPRQASDHVVNDGGTLAAQALERGDYARAAELYRKALVSAPESLALHFGLGVSASYLERRPEAVRELTWVLEHGDTRSNEVRAARRWLRSVGALPRLDHATTTALNEQPAAQDEKLATGSVHGSVMLDGTPRQRMQLFLVEHPARVKYFRLRTDEQGNFRFQNVSPGIYKLSERAAGDPTWRLRVEVKPGDDLTLDLSAANSTKVRDDFPELADDRPRDPRPRS